MVGSNEFQLCLHILEHSGNGCEPRYTIGVWDSTLQPPGLRALCHVQPIHEAVMAIAREFAASRQRKKEAQRGPQWSVVSNLIARLRNRSDTDSNGAADEIAELFSRFHNSTGDLEDARNRLARLGCVLEEAASKAHPVIGENGCYNSIVLPENIWSKLLTVYRNKQEGWQLYRELNALRELAAMTADTLRTVENWLGSAGTRESAMDSLWRLARHVQGLGYDLPVENLTWRGQLVRALEEAGLGIGADGTIRLRQSTDKYWQPATGEDIKSVLQRGIQPVSPHSHEVNHEQYNGHD